MRPRPNGSGELKSQWQIKVFETMARGVKRTCESMADKNIVWSRRPNEWPEESGELMSQ